MSIQRGEGEREVARPEAFSAGVMAVIITIMAFGLNVPKDTTWHAVGQHLPLRSGRRSGMGKSLDRLRTVRRGRAVVVRARPQAHPGGVALSEVNHGASRQAEIRRRAEN